MQLPSLILQLGAFNNVRIRYLTRYSAMLHHSPKRSMHISYDHFANNLGQGLSCAIHHGRVFLGPSKSLI